MKFSILYLFTILLIDCVPFEPGEDGRFESHSRAELNEDKVLCESELKDNVVTIDGIEYTFLPPSCQYNAQGGSLYFNMTVNGNYFSFRLAIDKYPTKNTLVIVEGGDGGKADLTLIDDINFFEGGAGVYYLQVENKPTIEISFCDVRFRNGQQNVTGNGRIICQ